MRLTRAQSVLVAVGALGIFFISGIILVQQERRPHFQAKISDLENDAAPHASAEPPGASPDLVEPTTVPGVSASSASSAGEVSPFSLRTFQRSEIRNGKKVWEVKGSQGEFFPQDSSVRVKDADLVAVTKGGDQVKVRAALAILHLDGASLKNVELTGAVKLVRNTELIIEAEHAIYDKERNEVSVPGKVRLRSPAFDLSGTKLTGNLENQHMVLASEVESTVYAAEQRPERAREFSAQLADQ